jgi:ribonuclease HI
MFAPSPLKYDWTKYCYTDGSHKEVREALDTLNTQDGEPIAKHYIAAALFAPDHSKAVTRTIDPHGKGVTNTINRAELVGISAALEYGYTMIATDSKCAIQTINKMLNRPDTMKQHVHRILLQHITTQLHAAVAKGWHITIQKVPAHSGLIGNVIADKFANIALGEVMHGQPCNISVAKGNDPHHHMPWPRSKPPTSEGDALQHTWELSDLKDCLSKHMHSRHTLGSSNKESIYFKSWSVLCAEADATASNHFMTSSGITHLERKRALQYRTGTLPTNKLLHRFDPNHTDKCPLCNEQDGGHHAISGCRIVAGTIGAERHHKLGRIIMKAIARGSKGATLVMADVGRKELLKVDGLDHLPCRLPDWLIPGSVIDPAKRMKLKSSFRPDGLMVTKSMHGCLDESSHIHIIELKCCRDSDRSHQEARAEGQHEQLAEFLAESWGCQVQLVPIMIGVGGTVYNTLKAQLLELGVAPTQYKAIAIALNHTAVQYVTKAMSYRWMAASTPNLQGHLNSNDVPCQVHIDASHSHGHYTNNGHHNARKRQRSGIG